MYEKGVAYLRNALCYGRAHNHVCEHVLYLNHGGESRDLNDRVLEISCRYSDKTSKQTYHTFL